MEREEIQPESFCDVVESPLEEYFVKIKGTYYDDLLTLKRWCLLFLNIYQFSSESIVDYVFKIFLFSMKFLLPF